jgi:tetratricopeptide (TPR) repeat protein
MRQRMLAKLTRPRLHDAVPRERLFALLDAARERKVTWITGPPGAGKTTLVVGWLESREIASIWYQVDGGDSDPGTFLHYLATTIAGRKATLPELRPEYLSQPVVLARHFFRSWYAALPDAAVVVLDNYQEAAPESMLHALMEQAVEELPDGLNLICISRTDPPASLALLAASRQLSFMDWDTLKLTLDETRRIVHRIHPLGTETIRWLHDRTDGWAAGVTLMLDRLRRNGGLPEDMEMETHEAVFTYFAGVMFDRLPPEDQRVLLAVSPLTSMTVEAARQLSESPNAERVLDRMFRHHWFTERRAGTKPAYHFHPLFHAFLRERAQATFDPSTWRDLLLRSASLLEAQGLVETAWSRYVDVQAWSEATSLVLRHAPMYAAQARGRTVCAWIDQLSPVVPPEPWFDYWRGVCLIPFDSTFARHSLEHAFAAFARSGLHDGMFLAASQLLAAIMWQWSDYSELDHWAGVVETLLDGPLPSTSASQIATGEAWLVQGLILGQASHPRIRRHAERLLDLIDTGSVSMDARLEAGAAIGRFLHFVPDQVLLQRLRTVIPATRGLLETSAFMWIDWASAFAHALQRNGETEEAEHLITEAMRLAPEYTTDRKIRWLHLVRCLLLLAGGRVDELRIAFGDFVRSMESVDDLGPNHLRQQMQSVLDLVDGRIDAACVAARRAADLADATGFAYIRTRSRPQLAVALAHAGRFDEAFAAIAEGQHIANGTALWYMPIELRLTEAYVLLNQGRLVEAHGVMRDALAEAHRRSDTWDFMDFCTPFARSRLYAEALRMGIETDLVRSIIRRHGVRPDSSADGTWPWPLHVRTIGRFEVRIHGHVIAWGRKAPRKCVELLKALVANGSDDVPESVLTDALWPEEEGDVAHNRYAVTLMRLRRLLGDPTLLRQQNGRLSLDPDRSWVDVQRWERALATRHPDPRHEAGPTQNWSPEDFLPEDADAPWAQPMRRKLRHAQQFARP